MAKARTYSVVISFIVLGAIAGYYFYDTFRIPSEIEKRAEIIKLEDRRKITENLTAYLTDDSARVRATAARAIGRIGTPGAADLLLGMLTDQAQQVGAAAAFGIGLTKDKDYADKLLAEAVDLPDRVAAVAVEAAGRLADSSMTDIHEELIVFLSHPAPEVRESACRAIYLAGGGKIADVLAAKLKSEKDKGVVSAGLFALARLGAIEGAELFINNLANPDPFVRMMAVRGLGKADLDDVEHYIAIALNDVDPNVVAQAIVELDRKQTTKAKEHLVEKLAQEKDEKLIAALFAAMTRQENDRAVTAAQDILTRQPATNIVSSIVTYLATILGERAIATIDSLARQPDVHVKAACVKAYGVIATPGVVSRVAMFFKDEDPIVRATALTGLLEIDSDNTDFHLRMAIADPDDVVVSLAVDHIAEQKLSEYLPLLDSLIDLGHEIDVTVRRSIVAATHPFLKEEATDSLARVILTAGILDREYIVRRDAAEIYRTMLDDNQYAAIGKAPGRYSQSDIEAALEKHTVNPYVLVRTNRGEFEMMLYFDIAPLTIMSFLDLVDSDFYDGLSFHRVIPGFVAQGGDPRGDGWGGPDWFIRCEYSQERYRRGTVGIATSGKDTGGSQFFITHISQPHLDGRYTVFGQVVTGMNIVDRLVVGDIIEKIELIED